MSGGSTCLNSRENSGKRSLQIFLRSLQIFLWSLQIFLRSHQNFLRSLLLIEKSLLFWVRQVHWVHRIFVSPIARVRTLSLCNLSSPFEVMMSSTSSSVLHME
jgi:hypothetical protein